MSTILKQRSYSGQCYLTGGEIIGDDSDTNVFLMISRTQWYPLMDRCCTGAPSPVVMAAWQSSAVARQPCLTMACTGEDSYSILVTKRSTTMRIRPWWHSGKPWPRAWPCGSARCAVVGLSVLASQW